MAKKPKREKTRKPAQRGKTSLARIVEKDLEIPADVAKSVKGGAYPRKPKCRPRPPLVPIPVKK